MPILIKPLNFMPANISKFCVFIVVKQNVVINVKCSVTHRMFKIWIIHIKVWGVCWTTDLWYKWGSHWNNDETNMMSLYNRIFLIRWIKFIIYSLSFLFLLLGFMPDKHSIGHTPHLQLYTWRKTSGVFCI
jgi:hypothetical protein